MKDGYVWEINTFGTTQFPHLPSLLEGLVIEDLEEKKNDENEIEVCFS